MEHRLQSDKKVYSSTTVKHTRILGEFVSRLFGPAQAHIHTLLNVTTKTNTNQRNRMTKHSIVIN